MITRISKKSLSAGVAEVLLQLLELLAAIAITAVVVRFGTTSAEGAGDPLVAELGEGFVSGNAQVNGTAIHYVRGGTGPALILVHGFPQDWYEYHSIMPRLAKRFTVVAVDLRGLGASKATAKKREITHYCKQIWYVLVCKTEPRPAFAESVSVGPGRRRCNYDIVSHPPVTVRLHNYAEVRAYLEQEHQDWLRALMPRHVNAPADYWPHKVLAVSSANAAMQNYVNVHEHQCYGIGYVILVSTQHTKTVYLLWDLLCSGIMVWLWDFGKHDLCHVIELRVLEKPCSRMLTC